MLRNFLSGISQKNARVSFFLLFSLLSLSVTFFVFADDTESNKNIFQDSDQDGLSNEEEALYKTDPLNKDSDGDGYSDGVEVESGYNPLKPAPGDKLVQDYKEDTRGVAIADSDTENLTTQVSNEIATMVQNSEDGSQVTLDAITESVQSVVNKTDQEITLPDVNIDDISIIKTPKKLSGEKLREKEKEDTLEYLTVMAYILANNSNKNFKTEQDLGSVLSSMGIEALTAATSGDMKYMEELSSRGDKILKEMRDIQVPEGMLDVHVKAIKMVKYSTKLKDEVRLDGVDDPIGQITSLGKVQGFMAAVADFSQEVYGKLQSYDIDIIPLSF